MCLRIVKSMATDGDFSMLKVLCVQVLLWSLVKAQMVDPDVGLTAQEQVLLLYDVKLQCLQNISEHDPEVSACHKMLRRKHSIQKSVISSTVSDFMDTLIVWTLLGFVTSQMTKYP